MKITIEELDVKDAEVGREIKYLKKTYIIRDMIKKIADYEQAMFSRVGSDNEPTPEELMDFSLKDSKDTVKLVENITEFIAGVLDKKQTKAFNEKIDNLEIETLIGIFEQLSTAIQIGDIELNADSVAEAKSGKA